MNTLQRAQYVLRSEQATCSCTDLFPIYRFYQEDLLANPEEMFTSGYFRAWSQRKRVAEAKPQSKEQWFSTVWKTINIECHGITLGLGQ